MANYQSLKAAINAVIKANGNKEITGTVLNEVLLAMVNSLGAGYQFAGVATPDTTPGTPDQKVFYIASQAGTYTNFGGAVVSDGIVIFEWNGTWTTETLDFPIPEQVQSDWTETDTTKKSYIKHKPNIPPSANVDPVPTNGSPNAVASGGVYNALKTITDFLNNGYYFVGIAGTSTEPDSVTQYGIFYIASDGGTYTYFLNGDDEPLTLYQGLNILYKDVEDDGWNYFEVFKFSDFVDTTQQQSLSSQQKAQARTNIAAVSYEQQSLNAGQQVQAQNNMMGKAYAPAQNSGLGKVYLDKNNGVLTQAMMQATNTVYVIQYDYTLNGNITVPAGCTLEFDGGSIGGSYTLTGNNTRINAEFVSIFKGVSIGGSWNVPTIYAEWFSIDETVGADNTPTIRNVFNLTNDSVQNVVIFSANKTYYISSHTQYSPEEILYCFLLKSNTEVVLDSNLYLNAFNGSHCYVFELRAVQNILIHGSGTIKGDVIAHLSEYLDEHSHGIMIHDCKNITIKDITVTEFMGDGICTDCFTGDYRTDPTQQPVDTFDISHHNKNILIDSVCIDGVRRNCIALQGDTGVEIKNCSFKNIGVNRRGFTFCYGIDIEPWRPNVGIHNVNIHDNVFDNITYVSGVGLGHIYINARGQAGSGMGYNININNNKCYDTTSDISIRFDGVRNCNIENQKIRLSDIKYATNVNISNCDIENTTARVESASNKFTFTNCNIKCSAYRFLYFTSVANYNMEADFINCNIKNDTESESYFASASKNTKISFYNCSFELNKKVNLGSIKEIIGCTFNAGGSIGLFLMQNDAEIVVAKNSIMSSSGDSVFSILSYDEITVTNTVSIHDNNIHASASEYIINKSENNYFTGTLLVINNSVDGKGRFNNCKGSNWTTKLANNKVIGVQDPDPYTGEQYIPYEGVPQIWNGASWTNII